MRSARDAVIGRRAPLSGCSRRADPSRLASPNGRGECAGARPRPEPVPRRDRWAVAPRRGRTRRPPTARATRPRGSAVRRIHRPRTGTYSSRPRRATSRLSFCARPKRLSSARKPPSSLRPSSVGASSSAWRRTRSPLPGWRQPPAAARRSAEADQGDGGEDGCRPWAPTGRQRCKACRWRTARPPGRSGHRAGRAGFLWEQPRRSRIEATALEGDTENEPRPRKCLHRVYILRLDQPVSSLRRRPGRDFGNPPSAVTGPRSTTPDPAQKSPPRSRRFGGGVRRRPRSRGGGEPAAANSGRSPRRCR